MNVASVLSKFSKARRTRRSSFSFCLSLFLSFQLSSWNKLSVRGDRLASEQLILKTSFLTNSNSWMCYRLQSKTHSHSPTPSLFCLNLCPHTQPFVRKGGHLRGSLCDYSHMAVALYFLFLFFHFYPQEENKERRGHICMDMVKILYCNMYKAAFFLFLIQSETLFHYPKDKYADAKRNSVPHPPILIFSYYSEDKHKLDNSFDVKKKTSKRK